MLVWVANFHSWGKVAMGTIPFFVLFLSNITPTQPPDFHSFPFPFSHQRYQMEA